jgi:hypothetical protein
VTAFCREWSITIDIELRAPLICFRHRYLCFRLRQLSTRLLQQTLRLRELTPSLVECGLKWTWINLKEQLALLDERPFRIGLLDEITRHLWFDVGVHSSVECSNPFLVKRDIFLSHLYDLNFDWRWNGVLPRFARAGGIHHERGNE